MVHGGVVLLLQIIVGIPSPQMKDGLLHAWYGARSASSERAYNLLVPAFAPDPVPFTVLAGTKFADVANPLCAKADGDEARRACLGQVYGALVASERTDTVAALVTQGAQERKRTRYVPSIHR